MPALKTLLIYAAAAATSALALPAPQGDGTASIANRDVIGVPVPCGCWDHCTLYKLTDPTVDCPIAPDNSCSKSQGCSSTIQSQFLYVASTQAD